MDYYGDKISPNMVLSPEGYLICKNVPIGRTGWMNYYGQELPAIFNEPAGKLVKVYRSPEELFDPETIASFEGKPVTNTHPVANLDVNTAPMTERGHAQNVRREGDFLMADLLVNDAGLISEIQNDIKREVSSGYNCAWRKIGDGQYEQYQIVGNHIAVVPNGRAGSKVAIHDSKPEEKEKMEVKPMKKVSKQILTALGFKQFVQDAEPEEIAKAMEIMQEEEEPKKEDVPATAPETKDAEENQVDNKKIVALEAKVDKLIDIVVQLAQAGKEEPKEIGAEQVMDDLEKELDGDGSEKETEKKTEDADPDPETPPSPETSGAADAALKKFVQDMKPVIMAIPDEKARTEAAKKFASSVHDARAKARNNGYADIIGAVAANKKAAMDAFKANKPTNMEEAAETAAKNWNEAGEKMKGGAK